MHRVLRRGWEAPSENPVRTRGAQDQSGIRAAFSLDTFFWRSKRKYLGRRSENRLQNTRRDSDTNPNNPASNRNFGVILFIVQVQNTITQAIFSTIPLQNSIHRAPDRSIGVILSNDRAPSSTNREKFLHHPSYFLNHSGSELNPPSSIPHYWSNFVQCPSFELERWRK